MNMEPENEEEENLRQSIKTLSISKKLLESDILRSSVLRHSQLEEEIFTPSNKDESDDNAILRVSIHPEDDMDISLYHTVHQEVDVSTSPITQEIETIEEAASNYAPIRIIKSLPPYPFIARPNEPPLLPPMNSSKKLTLVLDLDETLVHCSMSLLKDCHYIFPLIHNEREMTIYLRIRPYARQLLEYCASFCEIVIFTASIPDYANTVINLLDPKNQFVSHRLFRQHCTYVNGSYIKDLNRLGRDLSRTVIVDNSIVSFAYHFNNSIPIAPWYDDWEDRELYSLAFLVRTLVSYSNVQPFLESSFHLQNIVDSFEIV